MSGSEKLTFLISAVVSLTARIKAVDGKLDESFLNVDERTEKLSKKLKDQKDFISGPWRESTKMG